MTLHYISHQVSVTTPQLVTALGVDRVITCDWEYGEGSVSSQTALLGDGAVTCTSPVLNSTLVPDDTGIAHFLTSFSLSGNYEGGGAVYLSVSQGSNCKNTSTIY